MLKTFSVLAVLAIMTTVSAQQQPESALLDRARALHRQVPLIDGHNDYPWAVREKVQRDLDKLDITKPQPTIHTDIARLKAGGVGAQFWSVYTPSDFAGQTAVTATLEQIDIVHQMMRKYPQTFELALSATDVERIFKSGKIASMIGMEGGHSIDNSLATLRMMSALGAGYMTLTHGANVPWADAATDAPKLGGLSRFGEEVVREMNWLGMLVDLSHVSAGTMRAALDVSEAPVIFSHSSARAVCDVPRNVPDDVLARLADNGGVCMVTFVPSFVTPAIGEWRAQAGEAATAAGIAPNDVAEFDRFATAWAETHPKPPTTLDDVVAHVEHVREVAGAEHVGLGGDYDGAGGFADELRDVSGYPHLLAALADRGWSDADLARLTSGNVLRTLRAAEDVAARLQAEREPSVARIQDLDG
jgi:membrane dipeptidase